MDINKVKQLMVATEDKPGMLAEVSGVLSKSNININGFCAYSMDDQAIFYIVSSDSQKAKSALAAKGWQIKEEDVVVVGLENKVGSLSEISAKLKLNNINLIYCYGTTCDSSCACRFVFKAEDNDKAIAVLKNG